MIIFRKMYWQIMSGLLWSNHIKEKDKYRSWDRTSGKGKSNLKKEVNSNGNSTGSLSSIWEWYCITAPARKTFYKREKRKHVPGRQTEHTRWKVMWSWQLILNTYHRSEQQLKDLCKETDPYKKRNYNNGRFTSWKFTELSKQQKSCEQG